MNSLKILLVAPLFLLSVACGSGARLAPPDGFAELEDGDTYSYRATSAAGVVIGVRTEDNNPHGNLEFWTNALDLKLKKSGYAAISDAPTKVSSKAGLEGRRLRYQTKREGRTHEYWVTVFVTDASVIVVEAAGDEAFFDGATKKQIEAATQTVQTS
jgi:hypothetical protein